MPVLHHARIILSLLLTVTANAFAADKVTTIPVHFAKGASSATVSGSFSGYDTVHYTVAANAGQTMTVSISGSSNANFNILPVGAVAGQASAIGSGYVGSDWTDILPAKGTYTVEVYQMRASARRAEKVAYTMEIAIHGAAGGSHGAGKAAAAPSTAERAGQGDYDASGVLPCARYTGQPMAQCAFKVARGANGAATVSVNYPDGFTRAIFFEGGEVASADQSQADGGGKVTSSKESDLFFVRVGTERYEIPEVIVVGD